MKIVQINATCGSGSTGKICLAISHLLSQKGIENYILYSLGTSDYPLGIKFSNNWIRIVQTLFEKILGIYGFGCGISTFLLITKLKKINPDIIHLHNIHSHDVDLKLLFSYIRKKNIKVFWTFHDCWAFTGGCSYFDMVNCDKWKDNCGSCPQYKKHSLFFDKTSLNLNKKRKLYAYGLDLTIITPSIWLANLSKQSFMQDYKTNVINNGINLSVFKPIDSNFRKKWNSENKIVLLGVAFGWNARKGLDIFIRLAKDLDDKYQIVLVGTDYRIDKILPKNIISVHRTANQKELAQIYSASDLFLQLTREENFPTVNIEALACGTPVLSFRTGGSCEMLNSECGIMIDKDDYKSLFFELSSVKRKNLCTINSCIIQAQRYVDTDRFLEYCQLYDTTLNL